MSIILVAMFEMTFHDSMDTAKDLVENVNIKLVVHQSQISQRPGWVGLIKEFEILNDTCSWMSTNNVSDVCDLDDECCWIKKLVVNKTYEVANIEGLNKISTGLSPMDYEEILKNGLLREGKYAIMKSYLTPNETYWGVQYNQGMGWHRSEDTVHGINPKKGYLTNKKWIFNEDIANIIYDI